jgi:hypothetical protein
MRDRGFGFRLLIEILATFNLFDLDKDDAHG